MLAALPSATRYGWATLTTRALRHSAAKGATASQQDAIQSSRSWPPSRRPLHRRLRHHETELAALAATRALAAPTDAGPPQRAQRRCVASGPGAAARREGRNRPLSWYLSLWRAEARTCGSATRIRSTLPHHAVQRLSSSPRCAATVRAALDIPHLTSFLPETTLYRRPVSTDQTGWRER